MSWFKPGSFCAVRPCKISFLVGLSRACREVNGFGMSCVCSLYWQIFTTLRTRHMMRCASVQCLQRDVLLLSAPGTTVRFPIDVGYGCNELLFRLCAWGASLLWSVNIAVLAVSWSVGTTSYATGATSAQSIAWHITHITENAWEWESNQGTRLAIHHVRVSYMAVVRSRYGRRRVEYSFIYRPSTTHCRLWFAYRWRPWVSRTRKTRIHNYFNNTHSV